MPNSSFNPGTVAGVGGGGRDIEHVTALKSAPIPADKSTTMLAGYYAMNDGGGGRMVWDAASTAADDGGLVIQPTGLVGAGRYKRILPENRFNVKWWGAKGNNVQDDTVFIQNAINALIAYGLTFPVDMNYELFFPVGNYKLTAPIILDGPGTPSSAQGFALTGVASGTYIFGAFDDFMFQKVSAGTPRGPFRICNIRFANTLYPQTNAGILLFNNLIQTIVDACQFTSDGVCIKQFGNTFNCNVSNCGFTGQTLVNGVGDPGSKGIWGGSSVVGCDFSALGVAIQGALEVHNYRIEKCKTGIQIGSGSTASTAIVGKGSFEANDIAIDIQNGDRVSIDGPSIQGSALGPPGVYSSYGIKITILTHSKLARITASQHFTEAAIEIGQGAGFASDNWNEFENIRASNARPNRPGWSIRNQFCKASFINCDTPIGTYLNSDATANLLTNSLVNLAVPGLTQLDLLNGTFYAKNLRGKNVVVTAASTFLDIIFGAAAPTPTDGLGTLSAVAGGSLPNGTYYYTATTVTQRGETYHGPEKSIVLTGGNGTVNFTNTGIVANQSGQRRRVYRGTAPDTYDGYYDMPINNGTPYVWNDTGAAFDGFSRPPMSTGQTTNGNEKDALYSITVAPQWNTTVWITNKANTGFRINFGTAPVADSALDWHLIR